MKKGKVKADSATYLPFLDYGMKNGAWRLMYLSLRIELGWLCICSPMTEVSIVNCAGRSVFD